MPELIFYSRIPQQSKGSRQSTGNFGEISEDTHALLPALATYRVRVTGVARGRKGHLRTEEAERALSISSLRRRRMFDTINDLGTFSGLPRYTGHESC